MNLHTERLLSAWARHRAIAGQRVGLGGAVGWESRVNEQDEVGCSILNISVTASMADGRRQCPEQRESTN